MDSQQVDSGNYVEAGTKLTTMYKINPMKVSFTIPERFSDRVKSGQSVNVFVSSYPNEPFEGEVYFVSPNVREQTRDILIKARVSNPSGRLKPGMFARVELILGTHEKRPAVPAEALVATREGYIVFRVEDGTAKRQSVKIGLRQPGLVEIRDGLMPGDKIIETGHMSVADGTKIRDVSESS